LDIKKQVVIIGAGPIGLAMAARLVESKISFLIIERGISVGANILEWGDVQLFTDWQESVDYRSYQLFKKFDASISLPSQNPTGKELTNDFLIGLSSVPPIKENLVLESTVTKIKYKSASSLFEVNYIQHGSERKIHSDIVIDASGTWNNLNTLGDHESKVDPFVYYGIPDKEMIAKEMNSGTIAVVGNGHSAMNSLMSLSAHSNAELLWIIRSQEPRMGKSKVGGKSDLLEELVSQLLQTSRVKLVNNFSIKSVEVEEGQLNLRKNESSNLIEVDKLIINAGAKPNYSFLDNIELRLDHKYQVAIPLSDRIDPSKHSCDTVSYTLDDTLLTDIPYYVVGMKSFGKASNFLLSSGYIILDHLQSHLLNHIVNDKV